MKLDATDITILCKVVDNYGDIGFVYRLARQISSLTLSANPPETKTTLSIRLIVSNIDSFARMAPGIDPSLAYQEYNGWRVYDWNNSSVCTQAFTNEEPHIILECFQCGRPDWLEEILFGKGCKSIVHIINIDYLTAEPYADDFHCLQSATRSARVQKVNFMPGFTPKTGGLVLDEPFITYAKKNISQADTTRVPNTTPVFSVLFFSYEQDCMPIVKTLAQIPHAHIYAASGKSFAPFKQAFDACKAPFAFTALPYIPQQEWDKKLCSSSFNFVRGEDSLSRACLAGIPFLWHAYPQEENYQLVKVQALLDRMKPFFEQADFAVLSRCSLAYNKSRSAVAAPTGNADTRGTADTPQTIAFIAADTENLKLFESDLLYLLLNTQRLQPCFAAFSRSLIQNGDFAARLIEFIAKNSSDSRIDETC